MKTRIFVLSFCVVFLGCSLAAHADDGWKMPSLIPFKKKPSTRATASITDESNSGILPKMSMPELPKVPVPKMKMPKMEMPQWPPGTGKSTSTKRNHQPSTLEKLNRGAKDFFGKTKEVLMPWSKPKKRSSGHAKKDKGSFFGMSWPWGEEEEQPQVKTIQDFLSLDRPKI